MTQIFIDLGLSASVSAILGRLLSAAIVAAICYIVIRLVCRILRGLYDKTHFERGMKDFLLAATRVGLWCIAAVIIAGSLGIEVASLVAVLSVAGLALSLSVQGIMSNVFSGVTLLATRPCTVGDYVELNGVAGTVETVGLFYTSVTTPDNKLISIPNSEITSAKVTNYSREPDRRIDLRFSASYGDSTDKVRAAIMEAVMADGRVLAQPAPFVGIDSFGGSSISYITRVWVRNGDYWNVYYALNEAVRSSFERNGVEMTYDHINVHMVDGAKKD